MKLQFAMDVATLDEALALSRLVAGYVDIIGLGALLIKNEGVTAIGAIKASHPHSTVFADMKTVDAGEFEARIALDAGADLVSVMGAADDDTVTGAVVAARARGKGVVADMIAVGDRVTQRAREVTRMGVAFCQIPAGLDERTVHGPSVRGAIAAGRRSEVPFSVAGGVSLGTVRDVQAAGAVVAVVGAAIRGAPDPRIAAGRLRDAIDTAAVPDEPPWAGYGRPHGIPCGPGPRRARGATLVGRARSARPVG